MAWQRVPKVVGVNVRGTLDTHPVENTFYYQYTGTLSSGMINALVSAVSGAVVSSWLPLLSSAYVLTEVYAKDLDVQNGLQATSSCTSGCAGALTGDRLPNYATIAIARRSGLTGRSARGRIFWPVLAESQAANNSLATGVAADIVAAIGDVDTAAIAEDFLPVIVSRFIAGTLRPEALVFELAGWLAVNELLDTRRSRKPKE